MGKKLLVLTVIALLSLPAYALAGSCCGQPETQQTQSQNPGSKVQAGCPAVAASPAPSGTASEMTPGTSPSKPKAEPSKESAAAGKEKK